MRLSIAFVAGMWAQYAIDRAAPAASAPSFGTADIVAAAVLLAVLIVGAAWAVLWRGPRPLDGGVR